MKSSETQRRTGPIIALLIFAIAVLVIALAARFLPESSEPAHFAQTIEDPAPASQPAPDAGAAIEETIEAALSATPLPAEQAAIAQLAIAPAKKETPAAVTEEKPRAGVDREEKPREETRRVVREEAAPLRVRREDPPPPAVRSRVEEPVRDARTPAERALEQAIKRIETCPSMVDCLTSAKSALALFGAKDEITTPSKVTIAQFRDAQMTYRRGQADVLRIAKAIAKSSSGSKKEPELRRIFELLPQSDEWMFSSDELEPIRRALDRSVRLWLRDNRLDPQRSIGLAIGILTPTKKTDAEISVRLESGDETIGDPERLRSFVVREIQGLSELKGLARQRLARFKLVINPGGSYAMD